MFLTIQFIPFDFIILSDLNSNPNNLCEILFFRVFLVNCFTCLNISLIALEISKSPSLGSITKNLNQVLVLLLFVFSFCSQYFCLCFNFHQVLLRVYSHENISKPYNLKHYIVFACFLLQINSLFLSVLIVLLLE